MELFFLQHTAWRWANNLPLRDELTDAQYGIDYWHRHRRLFSKMTAYFVAFSRVRMPCTGYTVFPTSLSVKSHGPQMRLHIYHCIMQDIASTHVKDRIRERMSDTTARYEETKSATWKSLLVGRSDRIFNRLRMSGGVRSRTQWSWRWRPRKSVRSKGRQEQYPP